MGPIGTTLGWSRSSNTSVAKPFRQNVHCAVSSNDQYQGNAVSLVLVVTANRTVNVLVLWGVKIKNIHNFDKTWMTVPLWYKKCKIW